MDWHAKRYGRITGEQVLRCLELFEDAWRQRHETFGVSDSPEGWLKTVERLAAIPDWSSLYQHSFVELIAMMAVVSGLQDQLIEAASSPDPARAFLDVFESVLDDAPDHPAMLAPAMAMIGNLEAIARYSRSINDMIKACREQGDIDALRQALSVDSRLSVLPFVQAALRVGQLSGDDEALDYIVGGIRGPHKKRLMYPRLRWAEYLLRDQGAFEACTQEEIHELIVVHLGLYGDDGEHKDSKKALFAMFRKWRNAAKN